MLKVLRRMKTGRVGFRGYQLDWTIARRRVASPVASTTPPDPPAPAVPSVPAGGFKLHLGPGPNWSKPSSDWLTVDVDPARGDVAVDFNALERFPLPDGSVACIYGSHVFEHMSVYATPVIFRECHRVLRPGGVFRLIMPDARKSIEEYLAGNADFRLFARRRQRAAKQWGIPDYTLFESMREDFLSRTSQAELGANALAHQNAWDYETIRADLVRAGFSAEQVERTGFQQSRSTDFDWEGTFPSEANEADRSLYVEVVKD